MSTADAAELEARVEALARGLSAARPRALGLLADNGPEWVVVDLAAERAGIPLVPLPAFFTLQQMQYAAAQSGIDALFCDTPRLAETLGFHPASPPDGGALPWFCRCSTDAVPLDGAAKVTFTSGTTGAPKGVRLSSSQQHAVAASLVEATRSLRLERHLCLLPLAVLLENVAGARAALAAGAQCVLPRLADVGVGGATGFNARACLAAIQRWQPHSVILLPQMLFALTAAVEAGAPRPASLRFAAVGGAKIAAQALLRAREAGLPVYEGYGLSECASVVSLNLPGADRPGSVGRPLPHADVRVAPDGEIHVGEIATGDLGRLDADGFLRIEGRRKHVLITSFGRNVAPEWPEAELGAGGAIAQAAVFGDARPQLCAVIVPHDPAASDDAINHEVKLANARLPDYARIAFWLRADAPFSPAAGSATPNGRVRRDVVWARYGARLESRYREIAHALL